MLTAVLLRQRRQSRSRSETLGWPAVATARASDALCAPEQREPVGNSVDRVLPGHRLIPDAKRQMRNVDPALTLNVSGDLLLRCEVRRIDPGGAQFLDPRAVGPAEPGLSPVVRRKCRVGVCMSSPLAVVHNALQPPLSTGCLFSRRTIAVPQSIDCTSTFRPADTSIAAGDIGHRLAISADRSARAARSSRRCSRPP